MAIWHRPPSLDQLNGSSSDTLMAHLDIRYSEVGDDYLVATMPVDARTHQPFGMLHGGASVVLAETLGSVAGNYCVDPERYCCLGMEVNANHLRPVRRGRVTGTARPVMLGATSQVWEIRITSERGDLVCLSRLTLAVRKRVRRDTD
ncbi:hotdog fold thioesterase [Motiliproteus sediminis]|uniref:hotdog fold thioesterase n=1 Tax=Motiliproteus sediminis TaxID=1468178 RepID=UPI001AEF9B2E|nr:hotdog fold thioesterase [Motiliproteus sediminis]